VQQRDSIPGWEKCQLSPAENNMKTRCHRSFFASREAERHPPKEETTENFEQFFLLW
jgi:hypothetical protein